MKSILVATDLSAHSDRAFERAVVLADQHRAHLVVLHVVDEDQRRALIDQLVEAARHAIADDVAARVSRQRVAADIEVRVEAGRVYADIVRHADQLAAELIVLGTHRRDSLIDLFRGTTAERVLRTGRVPVLLVTDASHRPYERVLVAVDFSIHSRRAVQTAARLAPKAGFHLLHVFHVPFSGFIDSREVRDRLREEHLNQLNAMIDEELNALSGLARDVALPAEWLVQEGDVRTTIREEVQRLRPDLLVVGTHGRTGVGHALLGSVAEDLLRDPPCDIMAVKAW